MNIKKNSYLFIACLLTVGAFAEEECYEAPRSEEADKVLISNVKGIVLLSDASLAGKYDYRNVEGVEFVDMCTPDADDLSDKLSEYLNCPLTQCGLYGLEKTIILHYKRNYRPLVFVRVPDQEVSSGVLQLIVTESCVGEICACGAEWFSNQRIRDNITLEQGGIINERQLEDDLFWLNRNTFRRTDAIYSPGKEANTTNIEIVTKDRFPLRTYVGVDNTGIKNVGRTRVFGGFNWGNAFNLDHMLTYQYTASANFHAFQSHIAHYTAPLSWRHVFVAFGGYSTVFAHNIPGGLKSHGYALQASGRYIIPFKSMSHTLHEFTFGFDFKRTNNTLEFSEEPVFGQQTNLAQFCFEYLLGFDVCGAKTSLVASVYGSPASMLGDESKKDFSSLRPHAKPEYVYGRLSLSELIRVAGDWSFLGIFKGQLASANLLPSEQWGLGGYESVRGYDERVFNFDNAIQINLEFRTPPWKMGLDKCNWGEGDGLQALVFVDYGAGCNHFHVRGETFHQYIASVGPGLRYNINPYLFARLDWGIKLHHVHEDDLWSRLHFALTAGY